MAKILESLESAITAWVKHIHSQIQTDYQSATGASLEEITLQSGSPESTITIAIPDREKMTGIKTQEKEVWVPATMVVKQVNGRLTRQKRKGYKRTQKVEIKDEENSSPRADSKDSQTGSGKWIEEKVIDYHFKNDFSDFLIQHLNGKGHEAKRG
jgi:hypothetical protein|tara:strand:+ start:161 stop:625 length:465 start_codon:yes stop_codon:yes gene_type:complete